MNVEWEVFYRELWQFIVAISIQITATIAVTYLIIKTVYHFWCYNTCRKKNFNRYDTIQSIDKVFTISTMCYLLCFWTFVTSSLSLHSFVIFFNGSVWCWIIEFMTIWFMLSRIILQFIYILRYVNV